MIKSTESDSRNPPVPATNAMPTNHNRNGLTAILDAVHQRERSSTHSIGSNVADSSSGGKESSESYKKPQEDTGQQTQQSNESTSLQRSSHAVSKQGSDERIATPFLRKLYRLVSDPETEDLCSWTASGRSFVIWNPTAFARDVLPNYFKHNNLSSFVRQLNQYGFHKMHPDAWEFGHARFIRGREDLVATIERRPSRPGKGRWNDKDDESNHSPLQKRPKIDSFNNTDSLEEARNKASMETKMENIDGDQGPPYGRSIGGSVMSSNRLNSSATTLWQSYHPFVLNDTGHNVLKNGVDVTSAKSLSPQYCQPQYASSLSSGAVPWLSPTGMPTTELEKRICMIEQAIAQLYYTIHELCRDKDSLRHDILSMRTKIGETPTEDDGKVSKESLSTKQV
ncbi:Heat stress transcription factor A-3 [Galdieria sulphuraria]|nr:Heat stress transcription factor A-3 [Galdieria sulphuraria]